MANVLMKKETKHIGKLIKLSYPLILGGTNPRTKPNLLIYVHLNKTFFDKNSQKQHIFIFDIKTE